MLLQNYKKIITKILSVSLICSALFSLQATVVSAVGPYEYAFGVDHPDITFTVISGSKGSLKTLNTMPAARDIHNGLMSFGYFNSTYFEDNSAKAIVESIGKSAVFTYTGHAGAGMLYAVDSQNKVTYLTANKHASTMVHSIASYYDSSTSKFKNVRLAFFNGCRTANTDTSTNKFGNLLEKSVSLGADCALGYTDAVADSQASYFAKRVLVYYGADPKNAIQPSITSAITDTRKEFWFTGTSGVENAKAISETGKSPNSVYLSPAKYGT